MCSSDVTLQEQGLVSRLWRQACGFVSFGLSGLRNNRNYERLAFIDIKCKQRGAVDNTCTLCAPDAFFYVKCGSQSVSHSVSQSISQPRRPPTTPTATTYLAPKQPQLTNLSQRRFPQGSTGPLALAGINTSVSQPVSRQQASQFGGALRPFQDVETGARVTFLIR